jgi:hypothetical protein
LAFVAAAWQFTASATRSAKPSTDSSKNANLPSAHLAGQTLRYAAQLDLPAARRQAGGQWVALLPFSAAALHLKARQAWTRLPADRSAGPRARAPGTCYRACEFVAVGLTEGLGRANRDFYHAHGQPKQLYVRPLPPCARAVLPRGRRSADLPKHAEKIAGPAPSGPGHCARSLPASSDEMSL